MDERMERRPEGAGDEVMISVRGLTKSFKVFYDKGRNIKERVLFRGRGRYEKREVLRGISFDVRRGEAIGLVGSNGSGKSTTLKLLTGIMYPDSGTVALKGRVSALIELGAGFHPDMSGRENIYTNAAIFGLSRKEVDECMDDIIGFSELEEFIDNPVRTYSSGMYMRLAFSVAINVKADILLIDEILAVGDAAFQAKCFRKLQEIKGQGTTIVIVSHSLAQIEQICERSLWILDGKLEMEGPPREVHAEYMAYMSRKTEEHVSAEKAKEKEKQKAKEAAKEAAREAAKEAREAAGDAGNGAGEQEAAGAEGADAAPEAAEDGARQDTQTPNGKRWGSGEAEMESVELLDAAGEGQTRFEPGEDITVRIRYRAKKPLKDVVLGLAIYRADGTYIYGTNTLMDQMGVVSLEKAGEILLKMRGVALNQGDYAVDLALHRPDGFSYDFWRNTCVFTILKKKDEAGILHLEHDWEVREDR